MVRVKKALAKLQESTIGVDSVFQCNFRAQLSFWVDTTRAEQMDRIEK